jgi:hypothetical protein
MTDTLLALECCDCGQACRIALTLLTSDGRIVELAACAKCADGVTLKCYKTLRKDVYAWAKSHGLPVIRYGSKP